LEIRVAEASQLFLFLARPRIELRIAALAAVAELVLAAAVGFFGAGTASSPFTNF
jgi:hypothetical protein